MMQNHQYAVEWLDPGTCSYGYMFKVDEILYHSKSEYQDVKVIHNKIWGNVLLLDDMVMVTERDEFIYHETITHVPLLYSDWGIEKGMRTALIIGGGDGGTVRELLRYGIFKQIDMAEIDGAVIDVSKKFFPAFGSIWDDKRLKVHVEDGYKFLESKKNYYDFIIVDSTEPIGPGKVLYTENFYRLVRDALTEDGLISVQSLSPFFHKDESKELLKVIKSVFDKVLPYWTVIPSYMGNLWLFVMAGNKLNYNAYIAEELKSFEKDLKFFNLHMLPGYLKLPTIIKDLL